MLTKCTYFQKKFIKYRHKVSIILTFLHKNCNQLVIMQNKIFFSLYVIFTYPIVQESRKHLLIPGLCSAL